MLDTEMLYWLQIKTPAHPKHCRDSPDVESRHLSPAMSLLSPALGMPGIQMTDALKILSKTVVNKLKIMFMVKAFPKVTCNTACRTYENGIKPGCNLNNAN